MDTKTCSACQKEKPLSEFHKDTSKKSGVHYRCKECKNAYQTRRHNVLHSIVNKQKRVRRRLTPPDVNRAIDACKRARRLLAQGTHSASEIRELYKKQRGKCADCNRRLKKYQLDHITPLSKGGSNAIYNIQLLCPGCNRKKYSKDPIVHAQSLGRLL